MIQNKLVSTKKNIDIVKVSIAKTKFNKDIKVNYKDSKELNDNQLRHKKVKKRSYMFCGGASW
ncbi:hypothetical protein [Vallitalea guaymasensis]|uniref:hypothetical protein n=1 Tax=Vallitalea guaymasensis TaxID=1185412 RepID=UPI002354663B|nr:hypothetical protein [Vallitalea guaymasensis]